VHTDLGTATVLKIFRQEPKRQVIGMRVTNGLVRVDAIITVRRGGEQIGTGTIKKLQSGKEEIREAASPSECGCEIFGAPKLNEGDTLELYTEVEHRRVIN